MLINFVHAIFGILLRLPEAPPQILPSYYSGLVARPPFIVGRRICINDVRQAYQLRPHLVPVTDKDFILNFDEMLINFVPAIFSILLRLPEAPPQTLSSYSSGSVARPPS
ncbi:RNA polymerase sigma factor [Sesbania bispinosa]|nr:RNA polymerase sigma factor [Sesbania bispinosa]